MSSPPEEIDLQKWRARALRLVMLVGAASGLPAYLSVIANAFLDGRLTPLLWIYSAGYAGFVMLIFLPRINVPVRTWLFLAFTYAIAAASFARVGLAGSGRLYLVFLPAVATIFIGARGGYLCMGMSLALYSGFAALARAGLLSRWLTEPGNPLGLGFWIEAGVALGVFLVTLTVLLERFTTKHIQTLSASTRLTLELEDAYASLESRMQDRTREMGLLNSVAAVVSGLVGLGEILMVSLEKTMEAFAIEAGGAYWLEEESGTLVLAAHKGLSSRFAEQIARLDLVSVLAGRELNFEQPLTWAAADYPEGPFRQSIEAEGLKRIIVVPLAAKGTLVGGIVLNTREDRDLSSEEESLLIAIGQQIGLAIENARLLEKERAGRTEANRRREVAEGLRETLAVLNSDTPLQKTLNFIISQACRLMQCDASSLFQLESPEGPLSIRAACGLDPGYVTGVRFSPGRGGAGRALTERKPFAIPDAVEFIHTLVQEPGPGPREDREGLQRMIAAGYHALLSVPLIVQNEGYGGITLYYRAPRRFSDEEVQLATSIGIQAAMAIENARLRAQAGQTAAFAERNRLARELHDSVTQSLYSVTLYAEAAARLLGAGKSVEAGEHMRELGTTAREALREMRLLIFELSPPALETGSLADAIQTRLDAVESRGGMSVQFHVEGTERLGKECRQELYQIAQEALNNALKHSRAQAVRILLQYGEKETRLEISDDGVGFKLEQAMKSGGLGLRSMRERVQRISGALSVDTMPSGGTKVSVTAPTSP
ncbi:MAG: GAF domain-containing protein [Spirochaetia bacterium]|jgi:signal transduction histidine kinase